MDYQTAGVDIKAGDAFVEMIKPLAAATNRAGVVGGVGGFGALFDLKSAGLLDPILVATTDGVGTKLKLAIETGHHNTVGIDLVAMCVNDLLAQGATPLLFLDYLAVGRLDLMVAKQVMSGIIAGCHQAGCALVGGETAEMPGMYGAEDYDLAGFAVGAYERGRELPQELAEGDVILGLASSGVHSNGYSLVRRVLRDQYLTWGNKAPFAPLRTFGEVFLEPTRIYVQAILAAHHRALIRGIAHITGGGIASNLKRILPHGLKAVIDQPWPVPPEFVWLKTVGEISETDMLNTFNCGLGMLVIVRSCDVRETVMILESLGESVHEVGHLQRNVEVDVCVSVF
jgi:phosphoribosylformylglycinamidine cyclo-ligase